ncbi:hypothetical protein LNKW23_31080 [Paralimibaculum aggregatum]|uniref:DUF3619 family protein n=1 Tax=Paralimibaculum aggregatum TaxID=3036245 RepID=A0ABQ6LRD9_9RHOB|nr:hypothetical protein [Limibaculum sp. NKW23]GMG83894.1 hypothetical protein LNKW23_31080 [Limibaculum sp. NKW23]
MAEEWERDLETELARLAAAEAKLHPRPSAALTARVLADAAAAAPQAVPAGSGAVAAGARRGALDIVLDWGERLAARATGPRFGPGVAAAALVLCLGAGVGVGYTETPEPEAVELAALTLDPMYDEAADGFGPGLF